MDTDAEWVGVDFEFGKVDPAPTPSPPAKPRPPVQPRPPVEPPPRPTFPPQGPTTDSPHDAPEVEGITPPVSNSAAIVGGAVGGVLGVVLLMLVLYMLALRRKLSKAKDHGKASKYQLRVEDVAHLTNLDETSNTYVNTTDLQKLVTSVRAREKSQKRLPTPPRLQHQTPKPYRPAHGEAAPLEHLDNEGFRSDVVVVRAPMPLPNPYAGSGVLPAPNGRAQAQEEAVYSNLCEGAPPVTPFAKVQAPKIAPPPPPPSEKPKKRTSGEDMSDNTTGRAPPTAVARPAPPPPVGAKTQQAASPPQPQKPSPPPVASKPNKGLASEATAVPEASSTSPPWKAMFSKPTPPTLPKPGVLSKGKGLPPLKMALLPSVSRSSLDNCSSSSNTPDTCIMELTPDSTPTTEAKGSGSISAKVAFLEGKLKTPQKASRAMPPRT